MIRGLLLLKNFLISFLLSMLLLSCSAAKKSIEWKIIGNIPKSELIEIGIKEKSGNIRYKELNIIKTQAIKFGNEEQLCSVEHDSNYCVMVNQDNNCDILEIYVYPSRNLSESSDSYVVEAIDMPVLYFIENYDETVGRNYYIFSRDNTIDKCKEIRDEIINIDDIMNSADGDVAYYNSGEQKIDVPYNGYILKSQNYGNYVFLSTLWGQYCFY